MAMSGGVVLVTGAAGYIGEALVRALAARGDVRRILAFDQSPPDRRPLPGSADASAYARVEPIVGDLADLALAERLLDAEVDVVFHLASLVSGGAEADYARGLRVNLDASRALLDAAQRGARSPRFVFASSIAVYGPPAGGAALHVDDDTRPAPRLSYGTHKLMIELLINDMTRRGFVDGRSLRLPTVMVRNTGANSALSGWVSSLVREPLAGRDHVCPVQPRSQMACISLKRVVGAFLHAAELPSEALGAERTVLIEGLPASADELWTAVQAQAGARRLGRVRFAPDAALQAVTDGFARSTSSARAAALGFPRSASAAEIVADYIATLDRP